MLDRETLAAWLKLFAAPEQETNLIILGGEPTLHPDLAFGVKTARELGYSSVTIDTNGYLFHNILEKITPVEAVLALIAARKTPVLSAAAMFGVASIAKPLMKRSLATSEPAVTPVAWV